MIIWSAAQHSLGVASWVIVALLAWRGRWPERVAAIAFLVVMVASPLVGRLHFDGFRWGVALLSCGLLVTLFALALLAERWWLMAAAGLQIVAFSTWLAAFIEPSTQIWARSPYAWWSGSN